MLNNCSAILLAGGQSSRMGQDKGLMTFQGRPMIKHIIDTVSAVTDQIIIITGNEEYKQFGYPIYPDLLANKGPLVGIITGLSVSESDKNWVISCDSPYVTQELLYQLMEELEGFDAVVPNHKGKVHPLIATYQKSALNHLKEQLALDNLKLMVANAALNVNYYNADDFDAENFKNINTKEDL